MDLELFLKRVEVLIERKEEFFACSRVLEFLSFCPIVVKIMEENSNVVKAISDKSQSVISLELSHGLNLILKDFVQNIRGLYQKGVYNGRVYTEKFSLFDIQSEIDNGLTKITPMNFDTNECGETSEILVRSVDQLNLKERAIKKFRDMGIDFSEENKDLFFILFDVIDGDELILEFLCKNLLFQKNISVHKEYSLRNLIEDMEIKLNYSFGLNVEVDNRKDLGSLNSAPDDKKEKIKAGLFALLSPEEVTVLSILSVVFPEKISHENLKFIVKSGSLGLILKNLIEKGWVVVVRSSNAILYEPSWIQFILNYNERLINDSYDLIDAIDNIFIAYGKIFRNDEEEKIIAKISDFVDYGERLLEKSSKPSIWKLRLIGYFRSYSVKNSSGYSFDKEERWKNEFFRFVQFNLNIIYLFLKLKFISLLIKVKVSVLYLVQNTKRIPKAIGYGIFSIIMVPAAIFSISGFFSAPIGASYFPLRLYLLGHEDVDVVTRKVRFEANRHNGGEYFQVFGKKIRGHYNVSYSFFSKVNVGDTINVFIYEGLVVGCYLAGKEPSLFNILDAYDSSILGTFFLFGYSIVFILVVLILSIFNTYKVLKKIFKDVEKEIYTTKKPLNKIFLYGKPLITFFTGLAFAIAFSTIVIKAVVYFEKIDQMVAAIIIFYGFILLIFAPSMLYRLKNYFKNIQDTKLLFTIQYISILIGIYGVYKMFVFAKNISVSNPNDLFKLVIDFVKSISL